MFIRTSDYLPNKFKLFFLTLLNLTFIEKFKPKSLVKMNDSQSIC